MIIKVLLKSLHIPVILHKYNLEFYVDNDYKIMKFFEHYIEYITGANSDPTSDSYFYQLNYPSEYKSNETRIVKFERDYNRFLRV